MPGWKRSLFKNLSLFWTIKKYITGTEYPKPMIQGIIFDLFNTLVYEDRQPSRFEEFSRLIGKNPEDYAYKKLFEKSFMTEIIEAYSKPTLALLRELGLRANEELIDRLVAVLNDCEPQSFKFYEDVKPMLNALGGKYSLGILSNCNSIVYSKIRLKLKLEETFGSVVTSWQIATLKPDKAAFAAALNAIGLNRDQVVFVGNSFKDDVRAAENFGLNAVLIDRRNRFPQYSYRIERLPDILKHIK
jgi:HAD superfamily hydrolase (TIGR01509 family)